MEIRTLKCKHDRPIDVDCPYCKIDEFHAHLDICSQCRNHPFGLCSTGAKLLKEAAIGT